MLEDADIDHAVEMAVAGRFNNNGQNNSIKRFIAVAAVADEFLEKFTDKIASLKVGDRIKHTG
jgi:succinate-semialdehyde dehydrogenase/glutarate-semialdehyde dehydrogenase